MKGCNDYRESIRLYLDKELRGPYVVEFRAHMDKCADCCRAFEAEEEYARALRQWRPLYSAPDTLKERILRTIRASNQETTN
jgi:mycothiol system anti-sigma-R factor